MEELFFVARLQIDSQKRNEDIRFECHVDSSITYSRWPFVIQSLNGKLKRSQSKVVIYETIYALPGFSSVSICHTT
jgi:hypothetical protein